MLIGTSVLIFSTALLGGLPPLYGVGRRSAHGFAVADCVARGIFLAIGLTHLWVEAWQRFIGLGVKFPIIVSALIISMIAVLLSQYERLAYQLARDSLRWSAYSLVVMLSVHSVIAGASLGLEQQARHLFFLTLAIISHKGAAAFALALRLRQARLARSHATAVIALFALMTPLGVGFGGLALQHLQGSMVIWCEALFDTIAAGTFLYIALAQTDETPSLPLSVKAGYYAAGFSVIALSALLI